MNIFALNLNPEIAASEQCDQHVIKMSCEYAQLLSTCHRICDGMVWEGTSAKTGRKIKRYILEDDEMNENLYLACHNNHPSNIWVRQSVNNYQWLYKLWVSTCKEYSRRYDKVHASLIKLQQYLINPPVNIPNAPFTQPTPAMKQYPHCIVPGDSVQSYKNFYWEDKRKFATWTNRPKPKWWQEFEAKTDIHMNDKLVLT